MRISPEGIATYVETLRKKGLELLSDILQKRKQTGLQAIQKFYNVYKSIFSLKSRFETFEPLSL
jgi:hypothetical protein